MVKLHLTVLDPADLHAARQIGSDVLGAAIAEVAHAEA